MTERQAIMLTRYSEIVNIIGLKQGIHAGFYRETLDGTNGVFIERSWMATIPHIHPLMRGGDADISFGMVATSGWTKGYLLVPSLKSAGEEFAGVEPRRAILLDESWDDKVVNVLQSYNLMPAYDEDRGGIGYFLKLEIGNRDHFANLVYNEARRTSVEPLWTALMQSLIELADLYDDAELKESVYYDKLKEVYVK
jgi:hypothetical protein